jgi:pentatricopeptide repeat protein
MIMPRFLNLMTSVLTVGWFTCTLFGQTNFERALNRHRTNKILLLGQWSSADIAKWRQLIDDDRVYAHGFLLLDRPTLMSGGPMSGLTQNNIGAFDGFVRNRYALSSSAKWVALDMRNKMILSGTRVPDAEDFERQLDERKIKSPLSQIRDFLILNPDNLDAKEKLLKEVRRRALHRMPQDCAEDLNMEQDLKTWGMLAAETDRVFSGSWIGLTLDFFHPKYGQPEQYSPLMRNAFKKHLPKVEAAIRQDPINDSLWTIWAWLARSSPNYKWNVFFDSIDSFDLPESQNVAKWNTPRSNVYVWVVQDARSRGDWEAVVKYARLARGFTTDPAATEQIAAWNPAGGGPTRISLQGIDGYPLTSAYAPHIEALLRLGDIEGACKVYDEMVKAGLKGGIELAAGIAHSLKMEELAKRWEKGELIDDTPYFPSAFNTAGRYSYYAFADIRSEFRQKFVALLGQLYPRLQVSGEPWRDWENGASALGWRKEEGERWGIFSPQGILIEQGSTIPDLETMQSIFKRHGIENPIEYLRSYLSEKGSIPGLELHLAHQIMFRNFGATPRIEGKASLQDNEDESIWGEAVRLFRGVADNLDILSNLPSLGFYIKDAAVLSPLMKSISRQYLASIESLLKNKPSSDILWEQWFFWRSIEDARRPLKPTLDNIEPAPPAQITEILPQRVLTTYYEECKKDGNWEIVIELLEPVWARENERFLESRSQIEGLKQGSEHDRIVALAREQASSSLADGIATLLIEAYLHAGKPVAAGEIFDACLEAGSKFSSTARLINLAKSLGHERLASEWEKKIRLLQ